MTGSSVSRNWLARYGEKAQRVLARPAARVAVTILVALLLAEALLRVASPQVLIRIGGKDPTGLTVPDVELGFALAHNFAGPWVRDVEVRTNAIGLRDTDYGEKRPGEVRILSLGDSYAFGWGVDIQSSYPKIVERLLARTFPGCRIAVVNAAVHGYSTYQQIIMLNKLNQSISPDFVLSSFSAANDVIENATIRERIASNSNSSGGGVARNSHVARLLQRTFADAIYFASNRWPPNVNFTIGLMTLFEQRIGAIGVPLEMIMIPARHQVRASVHAGSGAMRWLRLEWLLTYHNSRVKDHFTRAGVSFTDALPALFEHDKVEPVLFVDDMHPNELGHQIMAQIVFDKIKHRIGELVARNCPARSVSNAGGELR